MYHDEVTLRVLEADKSVPTKVIKAVKKLKVKKDQTFSFIELANVVEDIDVLLSFIETVNVSIISYNPMPIFDLLQKTQDTFGDTRNGIGSIQKALDHLDEYTFQMSSKEAVEVRKGLIEGFNRYTAKEGWETDLHHIAIHAVNCCEQNFRFRLRGIFKHQRALMERVSELAAGTLYWDQVQLIETLYE